MERMGIDMLPWKTGKIAPTQRTGSAQEAKKTASWVKICVKSEQESSRKFLEKNSITSFFGGDVRDKILENFYKRFSESQENRTWLINFMKIWGRKNYLDQKPHFSEKVEKKAIWDDAGRQIAENCVIKNEEWYRFL